MNWIKCKDQLPDDNELVLVVNIDESDWEVTVGEYSATGWRVLNALGVINSTGYFPTSEFTHWMTLPEKPTE